MDGETLGTFVTSGCKITLRQTVNSLNILSLDSVSGVFCRPGLKFDLHPSLFHSHDLQFAFTICLIPCESSISGGVEYPKHKK